MKKQPYVTASVTIPHELRTSFDYPIVSIRTDADEIEHYTVINDLQQEKEYTEDLFDLENK